MEIIMGKYLYEKINEDTYYHTIKNEFHIFSFCYGVYLAYEQSSKESSFNEFFSTKKDLYLFNWHFVNKTHNYIISINDNIKKKELRKLGYTGFGSTPKCPKNAPFIQDEMFKLLDDITFADVYYKFLIENWNEKILNKSLLKYNIPNDLEKSINNTFHNFIGFQRRVLLLSDKKDGKKIYYQLKDNIQYAKIHERISNEKQ